MKKKIIGMLISTVLLTGCAFGGDSGYDGANRGEYSENGTDESDDGQAQSGNDSNGIKDPDIQVDIEGVRPCRDHVLAG